MRERIRVAVEARLEAAMVDEAAVRRSTRLTGVDLKQSPILSLTPEDWKVTG